MPEHQTTLPGAKLGAATIAVAGLAVVVLALAVHPAPQIVLSHQRESWESLAPLDQYKLEQQLRSSLIQVVASTLLVIGAITALRQFKVARAQAITDQSAKYVDAFTKAIEHLGAPNSSVSVAGVYALDRLAGADPTERHRIIHVLSAFVRSSQTPANSEAIAAAVRTLSRLRRGKEGVDLTGAYLADLSFDRLDLSRFILDRSDLSNCTFRRSQLVSASLQYTNLSGADFSHANATDASFDGSRFPNLITTDMVNPPPRQ